jgi:hypothetical protein
VGWSRHAQGILGQACDDAGVLLYRLSYVTEVTAGLEPATWPSTVVTDGRRPTRVFPCAVVVDDCRGLHSGVRRDYSTTPPGRVTVPRRTEPRPTWEGRRLAAAPSGTARRSLLGPTNQGVSTDVADLGLSSTYICMSTNRE